MIRLAALCALVLLAGCAASQCDPNQAGFFTGIGCAIGPGYAQRTQTLNGVLSSANANAVGAENSASAGEAARAAAETNLAYERQQLADLQDEQRNLARSLGAAKANHAADQAKLADAESKLAALKAETHKQAESPAPDPAAIEALKEQQQRLLKLVAQM